MIPPQPPADRSEQLEKAAQQTDRQVRRGFALANRGAYYAARAEFVAALRLLVQALDAEHRTTHHSRSLSAALTAMKEAQDFLPTGGKVESDLDLPTLIGSHRTPILKGAAAENLLPLAALKSYFTFAQEQFGAAAGREVAGSMALYALGKLHAVVAERKTADLPAAESKAVVFYQAALLACPRNHMAANDLGVLLAHEGYYPEARIAGTERLALAAVGQPEQPRRRLSAVGPAGDGGAGAAAGRVGSPHGSRSPENAADVGRRRRAVGRSEGLRGDGRGAGASGDGPEQKGVAKSPLSFRERGRG